MVRGLRASGRRTFRAETEEKRVCSAVGTKARIGVVAAIKAAPWLEAY
jgi:hypothetical protein